jgi:putative peptidoglycan lipid II flippase
VHETAVAFAFYCVGLFAWAGQQFVARGFYALQDTRTPTIIGSVLTIFFFIPICLWRYAHHNRTRAGAGHQRGSRGAFLRIWIALDIRMSQRRYNAPLRSERVLSSLLRTATACLVMGLAGMLANRPRAEFPRRRSPQSLCCTSFVVSVVATLAFVVAAQFFRVPEWDWLRDKLLRRRKTGSDAPTLVLIAHIGHCLCYVSRVLIRRQ